MILKSTTYGYLPLCTPKKGEPWFAGNVTIGYTAGDTRTEFVKACGQPWDELKKEGWLVVRVKVELAA